MTELYECPPTRSQRAKWVLEELGIEYSSRLVSLPDGEQDSAAYRAIHPLGVVPALKTDRYTMLESVAIVLQLVDEHLEKHLAPAIGTPERAEYYQWSVFACAELDPTIMMFFDNSMRQPAEDQDPALAAKGRRDFQPRARMLAQALEGRTYLLGDHFSGADILIGHSCFMATVTGLIGDHPALASYYARLEQRPAHRRAFGLTPLDTASDVIG